LGPRIRQRAAPGSSTLGCHSFELPRRSGLSLMAEKAALPAARTFRSGAASESGCSSDCFHVFCAPATADAVAIIVSGTRVRMLNNLERGRNIGASREAEGDSAYAGRRV